MFDIPVHCVSCTGAKSGIIFTGLLLQFLPANVTANSYCRYVVDVNWFLSLQTEPVFYIKMCTFVHVAMSKYVQFFVVMKTAL